MKRILIPTDFSEQAGHAMDLACQVAKERNVEIIVLHVVDLAGYVDFTSIGNSYSILSTPAGIGFDDKLLETLQSNAEEKLESFLCDCKKGDMKVITEIEIGNACHYITDYIKKHDIDLVIIGSRGEGGFEELLVGSTVEKVVRHARCPVLTVKQKTNLTDIKNIVFASNFTPDESHVTDDLKKLQDVFKAKLHLLKVNTPNSFETTRNTTRLIENFINENQLENYDVNIYNDLVEEDGIIYFARDIDADLIALATHGRSGLLHLLSGSIAEDVVNHAKRPVWTFRLKH